MAVTVADVATRLGVPIPSSGSPLAMQWQAWLSDALYLINARASRIGVIPVQADVDYVVTQAVVKMARNSDDATQVDIQIDDGRVSKRYQSSTGRIEILDEWWARLGLAQSSGAFSIRPSFTPDRCWWP